MNKPIIKQRLTTPSGANVRIVSAESKEYVPLADIAKALGYRVFHPKNSLLSTACKIHSADISFCVIPASTYVKGYVIELEKVIPALEAFCRLTLIPRGSEPLKMQRNEVCMLAQQLIELLNREVFHKNICNTNLEIDEDSFYDVAGSLGIGYDSITHEARVMLKTLADEAGEDEHGENILSYAIGIFCNDHYDELCSTIHGNYAFYTLEEIAENLRVILASQFGITARPKENIQMESKNETTIRAFTVKEIEDIGERANAIIKIYGLSLKDALHAVTIIKGEEINRDLTPLIEKLK